MKTKSNKIYNYVIPFILYLIMILALIGLFSWAFITDTIPRFRTMTTLKIYIIIVMIFLVLAYIILLIIILIFYLGIVVIISDSGIEKRNLFQKKVYSWDKIDYIYIDKMSDWLISNDRPGYYFVPYNQKKKRECIRIFKNKENEKILKQYVPKNKNVLPKPQHHN